MKAKVVLLARVNAGEGKFPRVPVAIRRRAIAIPVEHDGKFYSTPDIIGFYARWSHDKQRHIKPLGKDPVSAYTMFTQIEQDFSRVGAGLLPINEQVAPVEARMIGTCAEEFKANLVTRGKKAATIRKYTHTIDALVDMFPGKTIDAITKKDMLQHIDFLRGSIKKNKYGDINTTLRSRIKILNVFFHAFDLKSPLAQREIAKPMRSRPTRYSEELINTMLGAGTEDEKDLVHFFLNTGFRDEEVAYAKWTDIDLNAGSINVHAKPEYGWTPKDNESREQDIVLAEKFIKRMKARNMRQHKMNGAGTCGLIFPTKKGKPNMHLIFIVQDLAKRAGIKDKRITLHAFRRTFGSVVAKEYGIEQARIWLGHSDLVTTQKYIAAEEMTTVQARKKANDMFAGIGD